MHRAANPLINTAAGFTSDNLTFPNNVIGFESDTGRKKIGDGLTPWSTLDYSPADQGTSPVATVTVDEYGGKDVVTVLTLTNFVVGALAGAGAALGLGNIVYAFPAGQHFELVYSLSGISLTAAGTAVAGAKLGLGSVIATGAISVLSGTATFQDRLTGTTVPTASTGGAATSALLATTAGIGTGIALNVAASVKNVFLNCAATWNADNTGNLTASGVIVLKWVRMQ